VIVYYINKNPKSDYLLFNPVPTRPEAVQGGGYGEWRLDTFGANLAFSEKHGDAKW
jgi:hypothetical protein